MSIPVGLHSFPSQHRRAECDNVRLGYDVQSIYNMALQGDRLSGSVHVQPSEYSRMATIIIDIPDIGLRQCLYWLR